MKKTMKAAVVREFGKPLREREILGGHQVRLRTVGLRLDKLFACLNLRYRPLRFINFA
jgi:hypothetical protein